MKKILAMTISLLFVVSVFGVASAMAATTNPGCPYAEGYYQISRNSVKVGETFTISLTKAAMNDVEIQGKTVTEITLGIVANKKLPYQIGPVELINVEYFNDSGTLLYSGLVLPDALPSPDFPHWSEITPSWNDVAWIRWTFKGVTPGKLILNGACGETETVTILSKDLPFKFFAKLFGFGKKD
ncbi:MAG: hypothetical protein GKC01_06465 [Candidatus Methanofastidiosa archaeon]|nr:hypothetical protein [Candidatus Methanofastidiosa archaeon]